jgi:hypothetical protein
LFYLISSSAGFKSRYLKLPDIILKQEPKEGARFCAAVLKWKQSLQMHGQREGELIS